MQKVPFHCIVTTVLPAGPAAQHIVLIGIGVPLHQCHDATSFVIVGHFKAMIPRENNFRFRAIRNSASANGMANSRSLAALFNELQFPVSFNRSARTLHSPVGNHAHLPTCPLSDPPTQTPVEWSPRKKGKNSDDGAASLLIPLTNGSRITD